MSEQSHDNRERRKDPVEFNLKDGWNPGKFTLGMTLLKSNRGKQSYKRRDKTKSIID